MRHFFMGSKVYGRGFFLKDEEAKALLADGHNVSVVFPCIGGEDVNTDPRQAPPEYVVSFGQRTLSEARAWPAILNIIELRVKPERDSANEATADGAHRKKYWWQHAQPRPELYAAIAPLERCLVTSIHSKHLIFSFQPTDRVFSHGVYVFPLDAATAFAILQSRVHEPWARLLSSSMKMDLRYAASDCFETFSFPQPDPRTVISSLEDVGERLYTTRATYMVDTEQGLTKTYNAMKDPSSDDPRVLELRQLHEEMDRAVLDAYGWTDVSVPPYCPMNDADRAALQAFEDEVIDRLYVLNAERAREEERLGTGAKGRRTAPVDESEAVKPKPARKKAQKKAGAGEPESGAPQGKLF